MKVNLKVPLLTFQGKEIQLEGKPVLMSDQVGSVLWERATAGSPEEKYRLFKIAQRIAANPEEVELSADEVAAVKKNIAEVFSPGIFGQIVDTLENN